MAKTTPAQFMRQVRQEMGRVTWPKRKEVIFSTISVFVMVIIMSIFFLLVDQVIAFGVGLIIGG
ncbi:MAG: preprotein translocase subunit SecE [Alphaproteobacteria bacterium]|nr:preprotein translocase subunit SecE [Alphaproteobacteria bacterium]